MNQPHHTAQQPLSSEDILIALDQLEQTVEVMTAVIKRLKRELAQVLPVTEKTAAAKPSPPASDLASLMDLATPDKGWH